MTKRALAAALDPTGESITVAVITEWTRTRRIPHYRIGYRTLRYDLEKVKKAIEQFEVSSVC